jgi:hypothetical protein
MFDIIFISYDEPNADENFKRLKARFPHARRVHGVKGIANAHFEAAKLANTSMFYVVDGDAEVLDSFDFSYKPPEWDRQYVHIWNARNPIGTTYGYGGVKLFSKKLFKTVTNQLDFSTTLASGIKLMDEVACMTRFNSDNSRAFRGAFREGAKLQMIIRSNKPEIERTEAAVRLARWLDPRDDCEFREYISGGALAGVQEANSRPDDLLFINDHDLIMSRFYKSFPELDDRTDPKITEDHPMKHEFFFMTRIASALYDENVLQNLPITELRDAISDGQMLSKNWLIEELKKIIDAGQDGGPEKGDLRVAILGGWIGTLALLMFAYELPVAVYSFDLDDRANAIANTLNYDQPFKAVKADMYDVDYNQYDVIINTASEHIPDIPAWRAKLPRGKLVIVQNNDYLEGEGHVSTVENSHELSKQLDLSKVLYEGTRKFPMYSRFMLIGLT